MNLTNHLSMITVHIKLLILQVCQKRWRQEHFWGSVDIFEELHLTRVYETILGGDEYSIGPSLRCDLVVCEPAVYTLERAWNQVGGVLGLIVHIGFAAEHSQQVERERLSMKS